MPQSPVSLRFPRRRVQISCRRTGTSFGDPGWTLNIDIKVILISFICLNMWVNIMVLGLKPSTKIAAKTGNPAGLLFRRIWYSVGKSGVLGITEYRQGRPLHDMEQKSNCSRLAAWTRDFSLQHFQVCRCEATPARNSTTGRWSQPGEWSLY